MKDTLNGDHYMVRASPSSEAYNAGRLEASPQFDYFTRYVPRFNQGTYGNGLLSARKQMSLPSNTSSKGIHQSGDRNFRSYGTPQGPVATQIALTCSKCLGDDCLEVKSGSSRNVVCTNCRT